MTPTKLKYQGAVYVKAHTTRKAIKIEVDQMDMFVQMLALPSYKKAAQAFVKKNGTLLLCKMVGAILDWHGKAASSEDAKARIGQKAGYILMQPKVRKALQQVMKLKAPATLYRGLQIRDADSELNKKTVGDKFALSSSHFSSWTSEIAVARMFSHRFAKWPGLVLQNIKPLDADVVLAPPSATEPWFENLLQTVAHKIDREAGEYRDDEAEYMFATKGVVTPVKVIQVHSLKPAVTSTPFGPHKESPGTEELSKSLSDLFG